MPSGVRGGQAYRVPVIADIARLRLSIVVSNRPTTVLPRPITDHGSVLIGSLVTSTASDHSDCDGDRTVGRRHHTFLPFHGLIHGYRGSARFRSRDSLEVFVRRFR